MEEHAYSFLNFFFSLIKSSQISMECRIGIGLSDNIQRNQEIITAYITMMNEYRDIPMFKKLMLVFYAPEIQNKNLKLNSICNTANLLIIESETPEEKIISDLIQNNIQAVIRGSISANKMLAAIKKAIYNTPDIPMNRLALLETANGQQFLFAPVGIDEAETVDAKVEFIKLCDRLFTKFGLSVHINILGEGRLGDKGRSKIIDKKLDDTMYFLDQLKTLEKNKQLRSVYEYKEILIENAVETDKPCMIFAPDGISGNLIYRTLVHLGGGKSFGAIYLREFLEKHLVIIDTSRVAPDFELKGAVIFALSLMSLRRV